jgi:hypothetical protein
MSDVIDELLARGDVTANDPVWRHINTVARQFALPLPESLVKLWRQADGLAWDAMSADVLGPSGAMDVLANAPGEFRLAERGLLPVLHDRQSNYLMVVLRGPLAFRVVHQPHDDGARLLYRDLESCFRALIDAADQGEAADLFLYDTDGDYAPDAPRDAVDQDAARALLAGTHDHDEWTHAVRLLDSSQLQEWERVLEGDRFVRQEALERMRRMSSPAINELLARDAEAFEAFATDVSRSLRQAGFQVGRRDGPALEVAGTWLDLNAFFARRGISNAMERLVTWVKDQQARRDPNARPGNYMQD